MHADERRISLLRQLAFYLALSVALVGILASLYLLSMPSDEKGAFLFGYSFSRLLMVGVLLFGSFAIGFLGFYISKKIDGEKATALFRLFNKQIVVYGLFVLNIISLLGIWIMALAPAYLLGKYFAIAKRLLPFLLWVTSIIFALLVLSAVSNKNHSRSDKSILRKHLARFGRTFLIIVAIFLFIMGIYPRLTDQLWFGRYGVPILAVQIAASWSLVTVAMPLHGRLDEKFPLWIKKHSHVILFFLIWAITAGILVLQPIEFMGEMYSTAIEQHTKPLPPNYEIYPRKDSLTYYHISESIVIGTGIYRSIDKSLFLALEGINNWLAKGSYVRMLNYQTVILAVLPALLFLQGRKLFDTWGGVMAAILGIFQEANAIRLMDEFPLTSTKVLLSEPFMGVWTAVIALFAIYALTKEPEKNAHHYFLLGASIGLSALCRLNTFVVLPFILLILIVKFVKNWKHLLISCGLIALGLLAALLPWMIHNAIVYNNPIAFIDAKLRNVIIEGRWEKISKSNNNLEFSYSTSEMKDSMLRQVDALASKDAFLGGNAKKKSRIVRLFTIDTSAIINESLQPVECANIWKVGKSILRHTLNNYITSFSVFPVSFRPDDLFHGSRSQKFWGSYDSSSYAGINPIALIFNLFIISVGIYTSCSKHKIVGLVPMGVMCGYHLSNGVAISSGNRYAQPVSWVLLIYYAVGLISISWLILKAVGLKDNHPIKSNRVTHVSKASLLSLAIIVLAIGSLPVAADFLPVNRFPALSSEQLLNVLSFEDGAIASDEVAEIEQLLNLVKENQMKVNYGRVTSPILVTREEFKLMYGYEYGGSERFLTFMAFLPNNKNPRRMIFYPQDDQVYVENNSDVIIFYKDDKNSEILGLGIIDQDKAARVSSYSDIDEIPIERIYFSKQIFIK